MRNYDTFVALKRQKVEPVGFAPIKMTGKLFPFQRMITDWAVRRGRAAVFSACGTGKTVIELEWARNVSLHTGKPVLILAPLAVARQTEREGVKFDIPVNLCRFGADVAPGINVTNYERLHHFDAEMFGGLVADESSILKNFTGKMRKEITTFGLQIKFRLAATATPAPNDLIELSNHAEFLSVMSGKEIIALFFTQDGNTTHSWRLKGHAKQDFWRWLGSWSVALRMPSDLGFDDGDFVLPELRMHQHIVKSPPPEGMLFPLEAMTLDDQRVARRASMLERVRQAAKLVSKTNGMPWVLWCDLNAESNALKKAIPGSVEILGSDDPDKKEKALLDFAEGRIKALVTKPSIAGFGMNWQHCAHMAFVGISHSYEQFYQAIRRCWRFGQNKPVQCHIITSEAEKSVLQNVARKGEQAEEMMDSIVKHMSLEREQSKREEMRYEEESESGQGWAMYLGDTVRQLEKIESGSVGLTITSPPFPGMYSYTNSPHDIGNVTNIDKMIEHFRFLVSENALLRVTIAGRMCCIHLMQLTSMKSREGYIGLHDYRGRVIEMMIQEGWVYAGEATIDKNPQVQAVRNKERGLLFKTLAKDSSLLRMALADYLIYFRKPGENPAPIHAGISERYNPRGGWITEEEWIEWASPVWYRHTKNIPGGIRETDVLNVRQARETDDERHLCPLQLGVIERAVKLWSAPGDLVFDPFTGIGSTGVVALGLERKFVGCELKRSYYETAVHNLRAAVKQGSLF